MTKALVPTMGALHAGHLALVDRAQKLADDVVVSIFVNPTQFGAGEDFESYPRTLDADRALLGDRASVFAPTVDEVYPPDNPPELISAGFLGSAWEGVSRPGHFDGVLTVVNRLFDLVRPDVAVFGEKDWQQLALIRAMAALRHPEITIVGVPTVRDADGLALSSRNRYLTPAERETAALIPAALRDVAASGGTDESIVRASAKLDHAGIVLDYLDVVDPVTLEPIRGTGPALAIISARIGTTRLIDNLSIRD
ncbi:MAG: pantoate--beta-alanine ligase [Microbacteriaceae bacterium]